jgi:perosamine synthetase
MLKAHGVETRPFFFPAHRMPAFRTSESFPVAESISERGLNLPSSPELTVDQIHYISTHILRFLNDLG